MFAVVKVGAKQYQVKEKARILVEKLELEKDKSYSSEQVLLAVESDGKVEIGRPYVAGMKVDFKVVDQRKTEKIQGFKMKAKKRYRKRYGHRQNVTELEVVKLGKKADDSGKKKVSKENE